MQLLINHIFFFLAGFYFVDFNTKKFQKILSFSLNLKFRQSVIVKFAPFEFYRSSSYKLTQKKVQQMKTPKSTQSDFISDPIMGHIT